jgi:predicted MFS family arabinose efflux permease
MAVVGLPLGGILYEVFPATPFLFEVMAFAGAALFALLVRRPVEAPLLVPDDEAEPADPAGLPGTAAVVVAATLAGLATSAVLGVLVLFALDDLGLGAPAFGGLLAGLAGSTAIGGIAAPEIGSILGVRRGLVLATVVAAAGQAAASRVADPARPIVGAMALGVAAGAAMVAAILSRALLQLHAGRPVTGAALRRFHLAVWSAIPVGALLGGFVAKERSVHEVLLWAVAPWAGAAIAAIMARPAEKSSEFV